MVRDAHAWIIATLLILGTAAPVLASVQNANIESFTYQGNGDAQDVGNDLHLWQSEPHAFDVAVRSDGELDASACLVAGEDDGEQELVCQELSLSGNETRTATLSIDQWPANLTGKQKALAVVQEPNATRPLASETLELTVLQKDDDLDGDGLPNEREASLGTDLRGNDTDGDGLSDGAEVRTYESSPTTNDTDGDGLADREEVETHQTDPTSADTDDDGLPDPRELELETDPNKPDTDGDGIADGLEVNTYGTNSTEPDTDGDGLDDGAEIEEHETNPKKADTDDDGLDDNLEVSTYGTNPTQVDTDDDGLTDGVEVNEYQTDPTSSDTDDDGLTDGAEVNTYGTNPTNEDTDGDGLTDGEEVNEYETDPTDPDTDGDGEGDAIEIAEANSPPVAPAVVALGAVVLLLVFALVAARWAGRDPFAWSRRAVTDRFGGDRSSGEQTMEAPSGDRPSSQQESIAAVDTSVTPDPETNGDGVPPEFLSNEEQVLALIDDNDGRMRQTELVEATDWSKSKVSRVLSSMEADGDIVKVDVGRGNVVMRPGDLPPGAESAFEE